MLHEFQLSEEIIRPYMSEAEVPSLIQKHYGLKTKSVKELKSYDDKNYFVELAAEYYNNSSISKLSVNGYVLKILNSLDSKNIAVVEGQNLLMKYLHNNDFNVPVPIQGVNGCTLFLETGCNVSGVNETNEKQGETKGIEHVVRLLEYIPGKLVCEINIKENLLYELGTFAAKLNNTMKEFDNEALNSRKTIWKLSSVKELTKFLYVIKNEQRKKLIQDVIEAWNTVVEPCIPSLEQGIIHGDLNEQNILVAADEFDPSMYHIHGLIDFGDVSSSCYIFELAIVVMYMMIEVQDIDPHSAAGHVIAGYQVIRNLSENEWLVLKFKI